MSFESFDLLSAMKKYAEESTTTTNRSWLFFIFDLFGTNHHWTVTIKSVKEKIDALLLAIHHSPLSVKDIVKLMFLFSGVVSKELKQRIADSPEIRGIEYNGDDYISWFALDDGLELGEQVRYPERQKKRSDAPTPVAHTLRHASKKAEKSEEQKDPESAPAPVEETPRYPSSSRGLKRPAMDEVETSKKQKVPEAPRASMKARESSEADLKAKIEVQPELFEQIREAEAVAAWEAGLMVKQEIVEIVEISDTSNAPGATLTPEAEAASETVEVNVMDVSTTSRDLKQTWRVC